MLTIVDGLEAAAASGDAITLPAAAGTGIVNLAGDFSGIGLAVRAADGNEYSTMGDHMQIVEPKSGMPITLSFYEAYGRMQFEASAIWGMNVIQPKKLCRIMSY